MNAFSYQVLLLFWLRLHIVILAEHISPSTDKIPRLEHEQKWFSESIFQRHPKIKPEYCQRPAKCQALNFTTCMGAKLPYNSTTLDLTDLDSQEVVQDKLYLYQRLRNIPKCWTVIQPFLCSLYMPKCDGGKVDLPSKEICRIILGPCRILNDTALFSEFMKFMALCQDERLFPSNCTNDVHELKFNITGKCLEPLVPTDSTAWYYEGIEGCGLQCKDPLYTDSEHQQIHKLIAWGAGICFLSNIFTVITFMIDWKTANKYPALVIFYINLCFLVSCIGWLAQFSSPDARDDIVCRKDGTLRMSEPSAVENLSCVVVFVVVYYSLMAAMVWFVILSYAWHMSFRALGKIQERIDKKRAYFHLVAWSLPLMLTITTMALGEIEGDSISGICFVGFANPAVRGGLLLGPLACVFMVGGYFLSRGLLTLIKLKIGSREIISARASSKIRSTILRMGIFSVLIFVFGITTFVCHIYRFQNEKQWKASLRSYVLCLLTKTQTDRMHCKLETRPSVAMLQLHLLALFAAGVTMSSWVWTHSTVEAWTRFIRRKFGCEIEEPIKLQKHKVIAQAFAKRKMFYNAGRLSITFHNTHTDPVGINLELDSIASNDLSSTWAAALPKLVNRRGALTGAPTGSISSQRRNSMDSEISFSVRRVSLESRRNSVDSQVSLQIAELKTTRKVKSSGHRHRSRRRRRDFSSRRVSKTGPLFRRESSTSLDSQLGAHLLNALALGNADVKTLAPNLKRRTANAGLDQLLSNGKLVLPINIPGQSEMSEDENVSRTISESRFSLVVSGQTNEMVMKSLRKDLNIEEISTDEIEMKHSKSDRGSRTSRRSKKDRSKRRNERYETNTNTDDSYKEMRKELEDDSSLTSFCPELSHLAVQSSLNSGISLGEKNRASKQSKTSIDVGVQANAREIATQTQSSFDVDTELKENIEDLRNSRSKSQCVSQGTQMSPKSIRSSRESVSPFRDVTDNRKNVVDSDLDVEKNLEKIKKHKHKYHKSGKTNESEPLHKKKYNSKRNENISYENEKLLNDKYNIKISKTKY